MVQVIQQSGPSAATMRQMALDNALRNVVGGIQGLSEQSKAEKAQTERQKALNFDKTIQLRQMGYDVTPEDVSSGAVDFSKFTPEFAEEKEYKKFEREEDREAKKLEAELKRQQIEKTRAEANKIASEKSGTKSLDPTERLSKMSAEAQGKVGGIASALDALSGMEESIDNNVGPSRFNPDTPLIGTLISDTPYTQNERLVSEVLGRLQSGGAIQAEEIKTFRSMGPRPGDSPEIQKEKIAQQKAFLENKLIAFGLRPEELPSVGFSKPSRGLGGQPQNLADINVPMSPQNREIMPTAKASSVAPKYIDKASKMSREEKLKLINSGR